MSFLVLHYILMAGYQILNYIFFLHPLFVAVQLLFGYNSLLVDVIVSAFLLLGHSFLVRARKVSCDTIKLIVIN